MGNKIMYKGKLDSPELKEAMEKAPKLDIVENKDKKKTILGYECHEVIAKNIDGQGGTLTAYVSPKIKANTDIMKGLDVSQFPGFPLEFKMETGGMNLEVAVESFETKFDLGVFLLNYEGYKEMSEAEFLKGFGGGSGGFGF